MQCYYKQLREKNIHDNRVRSFPLTASYHLHFSFAWILTFLNHIFSFCHWNKSYFLYDHNNSASGKGIWDLKLISIISTFYMKTKLSQLEISVIYCVLLLFITCFPKCKIYFLKNTSFTCVISLNLNIPNGYIAWWSPYLRWRS